MEGLGKDVEITGSGGRPATIIRNFLQGSGLGSSLIWFGNVGAEPPHGPGPGKFPAQGC